jgi:hypothetical protein
MSSQKRTMPTVAKVRAHWAGWVRDTMDDDDESPLTMEDGRKGGLCYACGLYWTDCERAHIVARSNGGTDSVDNLHMLCRTCHRASEPHEGDAYWEWMTGWTMTHAILARRFAENPGAVAEVVMRSLRESA